MCGPAQLYRAGSRILGASGGLSPDPRGGELRSALRGLGMCCGGTFGLHMCLRCNEDATGTHVNNWKNWKWWYFSEIPGLWVLGKSWELFLEATKSVGQSEGLEACHLSSCHSYIQCTVSVFLMIGIAHVKCVDFTYSCLSTVCVRT